MKTKRQKEREKKHKAFIALFLKNKEQGNPLAWEDLEKKTGWTRQYLQRLLREKGIDYKQKAIEDGAKN